MEKVINRLMIATLVAAVLFGALAYHYRNAEHDTVFREEKSFQMCEYINIDLPSLPITLIPYDGERISVTYTSDLPLVFTLGDNLLSVAESEEFVISIFTEGENELGLYMYLPNKIFRDISVYSGTGNIKIGRVDCFNLSVITNSGDIHIENLLSHGSFTTTSGDISVNYKEIITESEIFSRNGDVEITFPKNGSVAVEFETQTGRCVTDLWGGNVNGSYVYSFNGGRRSIKATLQKGTLTIKEKE